MGQRLSHLPGSRTSPRGVTRRSRSTGTAAARGAAGSASERRPTPGTARPGPWLVSSRSLAGVHPPAARPVALGLPLLPLHARPLHLPQPPTTPRPHPAALRAPPNRSPRPVLHAPAAFLPPRPSRLQPEPPPASPHHPSCRAPAAPRPSPPLVPAPSPSFFSASGLASQRSPRLSPSLPPVRARPPRAPTPVHPARDRPDRDCDDPRPRFRAAPPRSHQLAPRFHAAPQRCGATPTSSGPPAGKTVQATLRTSGR